MDETTARNTLAEMVGMDDVPTLSPAAFELLVDYARVRDPYGLHPDDSGWTATWNLHRAASRGWKWKAGKLASQYQVSGGGQSLSRQQWWEHCIAMSDQYKSGNIGSIEVAPGGYWYTDVIGNLNVG
jgi:hypothetical protein